MVIVFCIFGAGANYAVADTEANTIKEEYLQKLLSVTFSTMTPTTESGSATIPGIGTISWNAGQTVDQFFRLGNFYDSFNLQLFSIKNVTDAAGIDASTLTLADLPFSHLTLQSLVTVIPDLGKWQVYQIPLVRDLLGTVLGGSSEPWDEITIQDAIKNYTFANVANLTLGKLDLTQYGVVDAIPGLFQTALARFPDWQKIVINQIPGLNQVAFSHFPTAPSGAGYVDLFDMPYGKKEARRINTITGSDVEGFHVPCKKNSCSYIELSGSPWLGAAALHGKQWIKGGNASDAQMVRGGSGALALVNLGKEPTGRHPFGRGFKVVLKRTNEAKGEAEFALYFRYCNAFGCSPYFLGPIPWLTNHEKDILFIGLTPATTPPPGIPTAPSAPAPEEPNLGTANPVVPVSADCLANLLKAIPAYMRASAQQSIPLILAEAQKDGVSDLGQIAYILATVQRESGFGLSMVEGNPPLNISGGIRYRGRGYVQISHDYNYKYWAKRLGVELYKNVDLATVPANAVQILVLGMRDGTYTGMTKKATLIPGGGLKLSDFINGSKTNFVQARRIVNGNDHAGEIAGHAQRFLAILRNCHLSSSGSGGSSGICRSQSKFLMPTTGVISSPFGPRASGFHPGLDIAAPVDTPVLAGDCGTVAFEKFNNGFNGGAGNYINIKHPNGFVTRYLHLSKVYVTSGVTVGRGQHIGDIGVTGNTTGPHLHFETHPNGGAAADPAKYL